jgi:uncharacterized protein YneF (UPF0154 family)
MTMRNSMQESGPFAKLLAAVGGVALLVLGFMFSLVVLAVALVVGLGVWGWFWWKTRKLRQQINEQMRENPPPGWEGPSSPAGHVIEGEAVIVEEEVTRVTSSRLPESPDRRSPD